jgi:hypothetical protein
MKIKEYIIGFDNHAAYHHLNSPKNIQMEFLSPSTISLVQPMDLGIIKNLIFNVIMKMKM